MSQRAGAKALRTAEVILALMRSSPLCAEAPIDNTRPAHGAFWTQFQADKHRSRPSASGRLMLSARSCSCDNGLSRNPSVQRKRRTSNLDHCRRSATMATHKASRRGNIHSQDDCADAGGHVSRAFASFARDQTCTSSLGCCDGPRLARKRPNETLLVAVNCATLHH